jgi:hypothetical protein
VAVEALPADNTSRAFLDYETCGQQHTLQVRVLEGATDSEVSSEVGSVCTAIGPICYVSTVIGLRRANIHSNVTVPAVWSGPASWGSGVGGTVVVPFMWSITGRDVTGHKVRWDWFGRSVNANSDYRLQSVDDSTVEAVLAAIDATEGTFVTINARTPILNKYANETVSGYWQRRLRL